MNERLENLMYEAGLTASGCWDRMDEYDQKALEKFSKLLIQECISVVQNLSPGYTDYRNQIEDAFRSDCIEEIRHHFGEK